MFIKTIIKFLKYLRLSPDVRKMHKAYKKLLKNQLFLESFPRKDLNYREVVFNDSL